MKRYAALILTAVVALLGAGGLTSSAQAQPAAYPTPVLELKLSLQTVVSGHTFVAKLLANVSCDPLTVTWDGQSASAIGKSLTHTFKAPIVTKPTVYPLTATCTYTGVAGTLGHSVQATVHRLTRTANITVLPVKSPSTTPGLPNTGGPSVGWFIGGAAAVIAGFSAMFYSRRRRGDGIAH